MSLMKLNKICFTICVVCIIAGTVLSLAMIWAELDYKEIVRKSWLTVCTFFLASALTWAVSKAFEYKRSREE